MQNDTNKTLQCRIFLLQSICDGANSCSYTYTSQLIDKCSPGYDADYVNIYYSCQTDDSSGNGTAAGNIRVTSQLLCWVVGWLSAFVK